MKIKKNNKSVIGLKKWLWPALLCMAVLMAGMHKK